MQCDIYNVFKCFFIVQSDDTMHFWLFIFFPSFFYFLPFYFFIWKKFKQIVVKPYIMYWNFVFSQDYISFMFCQDFILSFVF
jgi:hypothetical protein